MDYRDKIHKLLALAESPNENEAKAALLKARELMAEHKLSEADFVKKTGQEIKKILTKWTATKRTNPWRIDLSAVVADHYCCISFRQHKYNSNTYEIGFVGLEEDVALCEEVYDYAIKVVEAKQKEIRNLYKEYKGMRGIADLVRRECNSYGYGFCSGLVYAFRNQQKEKEQEWGLVLVVPQEVKDYTSSFKAENFEAKAANNINEDTYRAGVRDGRNFSTKEVLRPA